MIEKMIRVGRLYDFYGSLLTDRQRKCIEMHYLQDLSLGEIAAEFGVSRQAVNDILRRTEEAMEQYEAGLQLFQQEKKQDDVLHQVRDLIMDAMKAGHPADEKLQRALAAINLIQKEEKRY